MAYPIYELQRSKIGGRGGGARNRPRKDGNHNSILSHAANICDAVFDTAGLGDGFPDAVVAFGGEIYLVEIKDPAQPPNKRKLTEDEVVFHALWGRVAPRRIGIVETDDDLSRLVGLFS